MNDNLPSVPLVQASLVAAQNMIKIEVMPGVTDPIRSLMKVSVACVQTAERLLAQERVEDKPSIAVAPPGMRVARSD